MFIFLFLIIGLHVWTPAVITEVSIIAAELTIPTGIPTKEAKTGMEINPVTVEAKKTKCSVHIKILQIFLRFLLINSYWFLSSMK